MAGGADAVAAEELAKPRFELTAAHYAAPFTITFRYVNCVEVCCPCL
jgi:hypothetical protein